VSWLRNLGRKLSGAEAREAREAELAQRSEWDRRASELISEEEARSHFDGEAVVARLEAEMPREEAFERYVAHVQQKVSEVVRAALEDGLLSPDEEARIERVKSRYAESVRLDHETAALLETAKSQFQAWNEPLAPVQVPLLLQKGEWCVHAVKATAHEERQRTVRVNYGGPSARVRIAKGLYYNAGSIATERISEAYYHSFGEGVLGATSKRLLWVSPAKSISIPLGKIVLFEPYTDGIKIIKDTGKPVLFVFKGVDQPSMVRISRTIEELR
jgi:hypothetical protein